MVRAFGLAAVLVSMSVHPAYGQTAESEPNNAPETANPAVRGGKVTGTIEWGANTDDDYWVLTVNAGDTIFADVDANEFGSYIDPNLTLYGSDGTTVLARNSQWDGLDPHVTYVATTAGRYYLRIGSGYGGQGPQPYTLNFFEVKCPVGDESEPNDAASSAKSVTLPATIHGKACPANDTDYFKFSVTAGRKLTLQVDTVGRERPAFGCACQIVATIVLLSSDGRTELARTHEDDSPKHLEYDVSQSGTYYVAVGVWPGGIRYPYTLHMSASGGDVSGTGDPVIAHADGLGTPVAVITDPTGDFIVSDRDGNRVWWVAPDGRKQVISAELPGPTGLGWDMFANLIVIGPHAVFKMDPQGHMSQLFAHEGITDVALAPDGTLWFGDDRARSLRHYDARGSLITTIDLAAAIGVGPAHVAVARNGDVYFSDNNDSNPTGASTIYKLSGTQAQVVFTLPAIASDFALDANGNFYLASSTDNRIYRYSAFGAPQASPLATATAPAGITFGRNADGSMNNHVFVVENGGRLVELSSGATSELGAPIGFATIAQVIGDLLKPGALTDAQRHVLDTIGNKNGRYDVGDLRAFLLNNNSLSASHAH